MRFPFYNQLDSHDCGPTCLKMVAEYYGKVYALEYLRDSSYVTREGVSLLGISQAAEHIGLHTIMVKIDEPTLREDCPLPAILHWNNDHFVVLTKISERKSWLRKKPAQKKYTIADPGYGINVISENDFLKGWGAVESEGKGFALLMEPTSVFYSKKDHGADRNSYQFLLSYLRPYRKKLVKFSLFMVLSILITVSFPYLTRGLVDKGVLQKSYSFILMFGVAQVFLFISDTVLSLLRSWLLFHMNARISLNIVSDFLRKLMALPIRFFDSKSVGDISQRINDHNRIERFLTGDLVSSIFSVVYILVFTTILAFFSITLFAVFLTLSFVAVMWIMLFQKKRQRLDYIHFIQNKNTQDKLFEMVVGMQELKLYGSETSKRWEWEMMQRRLYRLNIKSLALEQYQNTGFSFLSQFKNIIITVLAAIFVMRDQMSFGTLLSISFILGQTNGPLDQLIRFFKSGQDARLSVNRLQEILQKQDEYQEHLHVGKNAGVIDGDIWLNNISFQYQGPRSPYVLKDVELLIPRGKITAIVGNSGSGKTTLMKLLLGFYSPVNGNIMVGEQDLASFSPSDWRSKCGTVMQDGYIFNDTIKRNIVMNGNNIDPVRLNNAIRISNIDEFVQELPLGYNTRIGNSGIGLSGGQKQRILIARAVYKDPEYLFFDEATSNLDANNEQKIMQHLNEFFHGRTVVIIAHRLSTVKNADQIIVLEKGEIREMGTHNSLTKEKGSYFALVKNQLELGG